MLQFIVEFFLYSYYFNDLIAFTVLYQIQSNRSLQLLFATDALNSDFLSQLDLSY